MTDGSSPHTLRRTPLADEHVALGGRMVDYAGWHMPVQYEGVKAEHLAVRAAAGLFDVSHMGEIEVEGPGAVGFVDRLVTNAVVRLADGQALYTCACNPRGTILDDLIVYRRAADRLLVVCNASNRAKMVAHFQAEAAASQAEHPCTVHDASDATALLALQGPRALHIAATLTPSGRARGDDGPSLPALPSFAFRDAVLAGVPCTVARTGYTGEDGVEIFTAADQAVALWRAILAAGRGDGLVPAGLAARNTLRLEARLCLYGNDIDESTSPYEAGLGWVVKLKDRDFIGKSALVEIRRARTAGNEHRELVGFEMVGRGIARDGYPLLDDDAQVIGRCTSGSVSPTLDKNIGLGYVPAKHAKPGTRLLVDCRGRHVEATVVPTPFYKRAV